MKFVRLTLILTLLCAAVPGIAAAQRAPSWSLDEVLTLLEVKLTTEQIMREIGTACLSFRTASAEERLKQAGADAALLTALRAQCYRAPETNTPVRMGTLVIVGELPPSWSRVVNQIPPNTNRTITLTPGRRGLVTIIAPGWCSERLELTMTPGEERNWTPVLRPRPWVGEC
jgi:hypothetical protein